MPKAFGATRLGLSRRALLKATAVGVTGLTAPALIGRTAVQGLSWSSGDPFSLGVASGAPSTQGFVIWTRLAPVPLSPDPATPGGMLQDAVPVIYEVAADDAMRQVVRRGTVSAEPSFAHALNVDVTDLAPGRSYWYRFSSGS